jgi:hypothetical protein
VLPTIERAVSINPDFAMESCEERRSDNPKNRSEEF